MRRYSSPCAEFSGSDRRAESGPPGPERPRALCNGRTPRIPKRESAGRDRYRDTACLADFRNNGIEKVSVVEVCHAVPKRADTRRTMPEAFRTDAASAVTLASTPILWNAFSTLRMFPIRNQRSLSSVHFTIPPAGVRHSFFHPAGRDRLQTGCCHVLTSREPSGFRCMPMAPSRSVR